MEKEKWLITFQENVTDVIFQTKLEFDCLELWKFIKELIYDKGYHLISITKVYD